MASITDLTRILHHIRVKLYHNYLPNAGKGTYIARTDSDKTVDVKDICTIMVTRAGFEGQFEPLLDHVTRFLDEVAYQICDGFRANLSYFSVYPNIGGVFDKVTEAHDHKKHPISFRFGALSKLRALVKNIDVEVEGLADVPAYIDEFIDVEDNSINQLYVPDNGFTIHGHNIKIEGDGVCGVYFVPVQDASKKVKVSRILENNPSKVMGIAPGTGCKVNRVEIVTRFTHGSFPLSNPRTITSSFTLEEA